jgi:hypothetical protein
MMEREISKGTFKLTISELGILITNKGVGRIKVTPAEIEKLCSFLSVGKVLSARQTLPPHITSSPFRVFFGEGEEDTTLTLYKKDHAREAMVPFSFDEIDTFIILLKQAVEVWKDILRLDPMSRTRPRAQSSFDPTFDGLD